MITLIFLLSFLIYILFLYLSNKSGEELTSTLFSNISNFSLLITIFTAIILVFSTAVMFKGINAEKYVEMYTAENELIETKIEEAVQTYIEHENETFISVKDKGGMYLISMYPELKSDTLITQQIEVYKENSDKIKKFKEQKISSDFCKFLIYFGGK